MGHNQNNRVPDMNNKPASSHPTSLYEETLEYVLMKRLCRLCTATYLMIFDNYLIKFKLSLNQVQQID